MRSPRPDNGPLVSSADAPGDNAATQVVLAFDDNRLASVLRFWDVLQGPRYAFWSFNDDYTLESLMEDIWRKTLEAWCPGGPASVS